ncbi:MAG: hypothetical protein RLZ98_1595 [Pseudomonadota bacterium]|jgi:hypothetical protein
MIAFLIMIPALLFMGGLLAVAVIFAENDDSAAGKAAIMLAERQASVCNGTLATQQLQS